MKKLLLFFGLMLISLQSIQATFKVNVGETSFDKAIDGYLNKNDYLQVIEVPFGINALTGVATIYYYYVDINGTVYSYAQVQKGQKTFDPRVDVIPASSVEIDNNGRVQTY